MILKISFGRSSLTLFVALTYGMGASGLLADKHFRAQDQLNFMRVYAVNKTSD